MESIGSVDNDLKATELRLGLPGRDDEEEEGGEEEEAVVVQQDHLSCPKITPNNKRPLSDQQLSDCESKQKGSSLHSKNAENVAAKSQIVGWPPVRFSRKNSFQLSKKTEEAAGSSSSGIYVKVSMDGAPFLRKIDLNGYNIHPQLLKAVENMFKLKIGEYMEKEGYKGSEYAPAYEDKDGDLMLVGDVPWDMFISSCKRLRIMKGSDAKGLGFGA